MARLKQVPRRQGAINSAGKTSNVPHHNIPVVMRSLSSSDNENDVNLPVANEPVAHPRVGGKTNTTMAKITAANARRRRKINLGQQIRRMQNQTNLFMPKLSFQRLVRQLTNEITPPGRLKFQKSAMLALQEASEIYLSELFEDANLLAIHAKRVTVMQKDMALAFRIKHGVSIREGRQDYNYANEQGYRVI